MLHPHTMDAYPASLLHLHSFATDSCRMPPKQVAAAARCCPIRWHAMVDRRRCSETGFEQRIGSSSCKNRTVGNLA